jgi:hypothetical protein
MMYVVDKDEAQKSPSTSKKEDSVEDAIPTKKKLIWDDKW